MPAAREDQTVLVVGGGLGGLLTAEKLARDGFAVTVVDKNERFGGCNAHLGVAGGGVPAAFYTVLGVEPGSSLRRALWPTGSNGEAPERMTILDHVFLPDGDISLAGDLDGFHHQLRHLFPAEGAAIDRLVTLIREIYDAIHTLFLPVTPPRRLRALQVLRRYGSLRYRDDLHESIADPALRRLLSIRAFASTNTVSTVLAYLGKGLIDGFYRLPGAGAGVVERLLEALARHGCRLLAGQQITRLLFADGVAVGARTIDGIDLHADHVVLATDVEQVVRHGIADDAIRARLVRRIDGFTAGLSALTVVFSLRPEMASRLARYRASARLVLLDDLDPFELLAKREAGVLDAGMVKIHLDLDDAAEPRLYAELDCSPQALDFAAMAGREEQALAPLIDDLGTRIERILPGFGSAIRALHVLTPHTYRQLTGSRSGAGSGWRDDVHMPAGLDHELAEIGLVLVGQWSMFGSGLSQLETSAQAAVRTIRRRALRGDR